ncbi:MAG TPA: hypothetical protein VGS58_02910 [Candidatus Sulfopaludibacter sp.]|nr:hypothetical protein [Candidatus Sulfopaludibacter sp.]
MTRARFGAAGAAYWTFPLAACLALHWLGFTAWFRADDFAWLGLTNTVHNFHDLLIALFQPRAQGTIRPWSERAFFMLGYTWFGLDALPFRIVIYATQLADIVLLMAIGNRLAGRRAAGFWAALLWIVNSSLAEPLGWICVYNEVLCAFFLLLAFWFLLRWIETGRARFNVYQWIVFVLGFGALELNVVYPALAAGYTFLCSRKHFRRTLPLFAVSAVYAAVHTWAAPPPQTGDYVMHYNGSMFRTLWTLWEWTVGSTYLSSPLGLRHWMMLAGVWIVTLALAWFAWSRWRDGDRAVLFCPLWYLAAIGPLLPLRDHVTEYYVYLPAIGICWLGGWALGRHPRVPAYAVAALYAFLTVPQLMVASDWNYRMTQRARNLVEGIAGAHRLHPNQWILLTGVDSDLFWNAIRDHPFQLLGIDHVYLAPGSESRIESHPGWGDLAEFVLPGAATTRALQRNLLVVYDTRGPRLRNITSVYEAMPRDDSLPRRLDVDDELTSNLLGPEWYPLDGNHRWMPKRASLKMAGPPAIGHSLILHGNCTDDQLHAGPLSVTVTVDGQTLPAKTIREASFELEFRLPDAVAGKREIQVTVEVNRTFRPAADPRDLGLAFGYFEVR